MSQTAALADKARLLIVDDEPLVCGMLRRLMRSRYEVFTATSGLEGLRLATAEPWDAILCDIMMPDLSGLAFLRQLRVTHAGLADRIGFMTGGAFVPEVRQFLEALGPHRWIAKPFMRADLEKFVERIRSAADD